MGGDFAVVSRFLDADFPDREIGVVGLGTIGADVALALALAGFEVIAIDQAHVLEAAADSLRSNLVRARLFQSDLRAVDIEATLAKILLTSDIAAVGNASVVIESVSEDEEIKQGVYRELDENCDDSTVFIVNTSCIPISVVASWVRHPERVIGLHFMNPVTAIRTVERIAPTAGADTLARVESLLKSLRMRSVSVNDSPGFVINRLLMPLVNDAARLVDEGVASATDIDRLFMGCLGHKMGPLATADLIGLDTVAHSLVVLQDRLDDPRYRPAPGLAQRVADGRLGRKSGEGFFKYAERSSGRS